MSWGLNSNILINLLSVQYALPKQSSAWFSSFLSVKNQFLDIFHEELEGRARKTKQNKEFSAQGYGFISKQAQLFTHHQIEKTIMFISVWIFIKLIFIMPPWLLKSMGSSRFFPVLLNLSYWEYGYVLKDMNKPNLEKLWEQRRERNKESTESVLKVIIYENVPVCGKYMWQYWGG